jgi:hypothetical protein
VHNLVCFASAAIAPLLMLRATFLLARTSSGIMISEAIARIIPGMLSSGGSRLTKVSHIWSIKE